MELFLMNYNFIERKGQRPVQEKYTKACTRKVYKRANSHIGLYKKLSRSTIFDEENLGTYTTAQSKTSQNRGF
jgi:hypothetical protein